MSDAKEKCDVLDDVERSFLSDLVGITMSQSEPWDRSIKDLIYAVMDVTPCFIGDVLDL